MCILIIIGKRRVFSPPVYYLEVIAKPEVQSPGLLKFATFGVIELCMSLHALSHLQRDADPQLPTAAGKVVVERVAVDLDAVAADELVGQCCLGMELQRPPARSVTSG